MILESRFADTQSRLESMQMLIKTDYILKESHNHIVSKSVEDTEKKVKLFLTSTFDEKELILNKTNEELKKKVDKESET